MAEQTLNIPQLLAVLVVGFLAIRWYFFSAPSSTPAASGQQHARHHPPGRSVNPAHVDQLTQMFPQLDRRSVMWDLQRNGGNVAATTERVLAGRGLDAPPPSFQPPTPPSRTSAPETQSSKSIHPDLITRYNLSAKILPPTPPSSSNDSPTTTTTTTAATSSGANGSEASWSVNRNERQALLQRRRDEMILAARRKMEERDRERGKVA